MAPPAGQVRPGRYLAFFTLIVVLLYGLVFFTGGGEPTPKLGIDLQGGTRVTLTAQTPDGSDPSREQLQQARQIVENRVNGIGVSGAEVLLDGSNVVITVPGDEGQQAKTLGQTAKLGFRKVLNVQPAGMPGQDVPGGEGLEQEVPGGLDQELPEDLEEQLPDDLEEQLPDDLEDQLPEDLEDELPDGLDLEEEVPGQAPGQDQTPAGGGSAPGVVSAQDPDGDDGEDGDEPETPQEQTAQEIQQEQEARQDPVLAPTDPGDEAEMMAAQQAQQEALADLECSPESNDPLAGNDDPDLPLATCDQDGTQKYVLSPVFLQGTEIDDASANIDNESGEWFVNLSFDSEGGSTWAEFTAANINESAAFVLDTEVVSAPTIQDSIPGGNTQITGQFSQQEAEDLAEVLKYGSLPLSFTSSDATTVSATLGLASLETGLIAGAIGFLLVFIYCLFYYRMLGGLTILSLILSGTVVYAVLVLLGRWIGFTLDLAGVAGFIVAVGVTADSFVVYFERIKDEMREGRTFRSSVPRGWIKARRTILASDAIMFLAAIVLYILAVGEVKGFAFTLGLSTVLDLIVVFLVTHPLVVLVARSKRLSSPRLSGLGSVQRFGAARRSASRSGTAVKEA